MDNNSPTDNSFEKACKHKALDAALNLRGYDYSMDVLSKAEEIYQWLIKFDATVKQE